MLFEAIFEVAGRFRVDDFSWQVSSIIWYPVCLKVFALLEFCNVFHDPLLVFSDFPSRSFVRHPFATFDRILPDNFADTVVYFEEMDQITSFASFGKTGEFEFAYSLGSLDWILISLLVFVPSQA